MRLVPRLRSQTHGRNSLIAKGADRSRRPLEDALSSLRYGQYQTGPAAKHPKVCQPDGRA